MILYVLNVDPITTFKKANVLNVIPDPMITVMVLMVSTKYNVEVKSGTKKILSHQHFLMKAKDI